MPFSRRHQEAGSIRIPEQDPPTWKRRMPTIQREKRSVSASLDVEENLGTTDKVRGQSRSHKPRGRPRTDDSQAPVLTAARRSQVRRAQRTYRLKKEATVRSYMARITSLEARIEEITDSLTELHDIAVRADLEQTHPALYTRLREICCNQAGKADAANLPSLPKTAVSNIAGIEDTAQVCNDDLSHQNLPIFGIVISNEYNDRSISVSPSSRHAQSQTSPMHRSIDGEEFLQTALLRLRDIERPLGQSIPIVNSFHEKDFVRRLHRSSLEHVYRLFLDNHSDPNVTYRMFRLVPVIRDKDRMSPYFQKLVQAGEAEPLEIDCLPFYSIGGAGTHYRRTDEFGLPIYPHNCRLPKRLLGIPPSIKSACKNTTSDEYQNHLRLFGLDGEWFDCQDVEGYLKHMGVALDQSSSFAEIYVTTPSTPTSHSLADGEQNRVSREGSNDTLSKDDGSVWKDLSLEVDDTSSGVNLTTTSLVMPRCVLDVENFVSILLKGLVILGRAPGFKRSSVEAAFLSSLTSVAYNTEED